MTEKSTNLLRLTHEQAKQLDPDDYVKWLRLNGYSDLIYQAPRKDYHEEMRELAERSIERMKQRNF